MIGAKKIKRIVFVHPARITTWIQPFASAAQRYPPISAWEELVGSQSHHVMRFQAIAPPSQQNMTRGVTKAISIIQLPIVFATAVPTINTATKLKNAAQSTAIRGERTRVATIVAIELALSCIPFVKSNTSATRIMIVTNGY